MHTACLLEKWTLGEKLARAPLSFLGNRKLLAAEALANEEMRVHFCNVSHTHTPNHVKGIGA